MVFHVSIEWSGALQFVCAKKLSRKKGKENVFGHWEVPVQFK